MSKKQKRKPSLKKHIILLSVLVFLIVIGVVLAGYGSLDLIPSGENDKENAIKALNGEINPFDIDYGKPFDIMISDGVTFQYNDLNLSKGFYLNQIPGLGVLNVTYSQFQIQFVSKKMFVSADIRDSKNNPIVQIVNNTWNTVDPHYALAFWDRNYNAYTFEAINSLGIPILHIAMVGSNKIRLDGLFYTQKGSVYIGANSDGSAVFVINVRPDQHLEENYSYATLFRYPAMTNSSNLGKMLNPYYPSSDPLSEPNSRIQLGYEFYYGGTILGIISTTLLAIPITNIIRILWRKPKPKKPVQIIIHPRR
jgi:hypothetical protein